MSGQSFYREEELLNRPHSNKLLKYTPIIPIPPAFGSTVGNDPSGILLNLWRQRTRVPDLSYGIVCVIGRLAVLTEYRLVTDRQTDGRRTDTRRQHYIPRCHSVAR